MAVADAKDRDIIPFAFVDNDVRLVWMRANRGIEFITQARRLWKCGEQIKRPIEAVQIPIRLRSAKTLYAFGEDRRQIIGGGAPQSIVRQ